MSNDTQIGAHDDHAEVISLRKLMEDMWSGKWTIFGFTFVAALASVVISLMLPNHYRSSVLLAPTENQSSGGIAALASQYSGLASFAGVDLSTGDSDQVALGLEVLQSRKFLSEFIERRQILVELIAGKEWDPDTESLVIDPDIYDIAADEWIREVSPPLMTIPSSQEAVEVLRDILSVSRDKSTGFIEVSVEFLAPTLAKDWAQWLVEDVNDVMMTHDVQIAQQTIDYLSEQIESTPLTGLQQVFFKLIEEQTKVIVLAEVTDEYLLRTIDPAVVPEKKSKPFRSLIVIIATFLGGFAGVLTHLIHLQLAPASRN